MLKGSFLIIMIIMNSNMAGKHSNHYTNLSQEFEML